MEVAPTQWYLNPLAIAVFTGLATAFFTGVGWGAKELITYYRRRIVSVGNPKYSVTLTKYGKEGYSTLGLLLEPSGVHIKARQTGGYLRSDAEVTVARNSKLILHGWEIADERWKAIQYIGLLTTSEVDRSLWESKGLPLKKAKVTMRVYVNDRLKTLKGRVAQVTVEYIDTVGRQPGFKKVI